MHLTLTLRCRAGVGGCIGGTQFAQFALWLANVQSPITIAQNKTFFHTSYNYFLTPARVIEWYLHVM